MLKLPKMSKSEYYWKDKEKGSFRFTVNQVTICSNKPRLLTTNIRPGEDLGRGLMNLVLLLCNTKMPKFGGIRSLECQGNCHISLSGFTTILAKIFQTKL